MFQCQCWGINERNEVLGPHFWEGKMGGNQPPICFMGVNGGKLGSVVHFWGMNGGKCTHFWGGDEGKCVPLGIRGKIGFSAPFWGINERKKGVFWSVLG